MRPPSEVGGVDPSQRPGRHELPPNPRPDKALRRLSSRNTGPPRYHIVAEIGRGAGGTLLRVWDEALCRHIAMKVLPGDATSFTLGCFLWEAQITGQLDHPGIVPVHDVGVLPDRRVFYTMRLVEGRRLDDVLKLARARAGGRSQKRALGVLVEVCEAVAYAHSRRVIHRDLKPANVLVDARGLPVVADFVLAALTWGMSKMSPEQAPDSRVDASPDVCGLGAIFYELLAGSPRPPRPLREVAPQAPPELVTVAERATSRDMAARYPDVDALTEDLRAFDDAGAPGLLD